MLIGKNWKSLISSIANRKKAIFRHRFLVFLCLCFALLYLQITAYAQQSISIFIGDVCEGSGNVNLDCNFAYANPSDTDEAAAKFVCTVQQHHTGYKFARVSVRGGGRCGQILIFARCID
jgi:hypothetical protein